MAIPAEAATELLAQARPLEPSTATRTDPVDQDGDLSPGEPHLTRPTSTLPAHRNQATGGNPGADGSGTHPEDLDDLLDRYQHVIGGGHSFKSFPALYSMRSERACPEAFCYPTSHNGTYVKYVCTLKTPFLLAFFHILQ